MYRIYQISDELSLLDIANKFNTTEDELKLINGLNDNVTIKRGDFIIVPMKDTAQNENFDIYVVKQGDSIYKIAQSYGVNYNELADLNGLDKDEYIYANQEILVPKRNVQFTITDTRDTLNDVANRLSTKVSDIIEQNKTIFLAPEQLIVYKKRD